MTKYPAVLALIGFFIFTIMDLNIKGLLQVYGLMQVTFFNSLFALIALMIWIYPNFDRLKTKRPKLHLLRAIGLVVADLLAFYSFGKAEVTEVYSLLLTMPLFTVLFATLFSIEKLSLFRMTISFLGFCGVLMVLNPSYSQFNTALLAAMGCACIEAISFLLISKFKQEESTESYVFYGLLLLTIVSGVAMSVNFQLFTMQYLGFSIVGGLAYAIGTVCVILAFVHGIPSIVSSMQYSQLFWGMLLAYIIWHETPDIYAILGGLIIVAAGLILTLKKPTKESDLN